jgi:hypothetical protein
MNKQRNITIFLAASIALGGMLATSTPFAQETPTMLMEQVRKMGARWVVSNLCDKRGEWDRVINRIATGQESWVELAIALHLGSDAGSACELHDAMFQGLGQNPSYVLRRAEPTYPLSDLCEGRHDPLPTYKDAITEQERTIAAVKEVKSEELKSKKDACLSKLEEGKGHLRRFFGISTN